MDRLIFNQTGGFPLTTDILNALQNAYNVFNAMSGLSGNLAILSGCETQGNNVSDGVVVIGNEVFAFKGGVISDKVIIKEETESKLFEDGSSKSVIIRKTATFGNGTTTYNWADFFRIKDNKTLQKEIFKDENSLEKRLENLEEKLRKTIPIGLVAIWDRPANQIPEGWVEHTEMQGFTPVGQKVGDDDFGTLGKTLGAKTHKLTINEMPKHSHSTSVVVSGDDLGYTDGRGYVMGRSEFATRENTPITIKNTGDDKAHNNIQPSRIVRFIRFVGW